MTTPTSYVGMQPMRYEIVIESTCGCYPTERMQTNSMQTANRELFKPLEEGHGWHLTMFIDGEPAAWRTDFLR